MKKEIEIESQLNCQVNIIPAEIMAKLPTLGTLSKSDINLIPDKEIKDAIKAILESGYTLRDYMSTLGKEKNIALSTLTALLSKKNMSETSIMTELKGKTAYLPPDNRTQERKEVLKNMGKVNLENKIIHHLMEDGLTWQRMLDDKFQMKKDTFDRLLNDMQLNKSDFQTLKEIKEEYAFKTFRELPQNNFLEAIETKGFASAWARTEGIEEHIVRACLKEVAKERQISKKRPEPTNSKKKYLSKYKDPSYKPRRSDSKAGQVYTAFTKISDDDFKARYIKKVNLKLDQLVFDHKLDIPTTKHYLAARRKKLRELIAAKSVLGMHSASDDLVDNKEINELNEISTHQLPEPSKKRHTSSIDALNEKKSSQDNGECSISKSSRSTLPGIFFKINSDATVPCVKKDINVNAINEVKFAHNQNKLIKKIENSKQNAFNFNEEEILERIELYKVRKKGIFAKLAKAWEEELPDPLNFDKSPPGI